jgi:proliferating cell nuclear antigen
MKIEKSRFTAFCEAVLAIAPECRMYLKNTGLEVRAVDAANVAMISAKLPKEAFAEYKEETGILGFDLLKLKTAAGLMKAGMLEIKQDGKGARLKITDGSNKYSAALLDISTIRKDPNPPTIVLPAVVTVNAKELQESINNMGKIGEKIRFSLQGNTLTLTTEGDTDLLVKGIEGEALKSLKEPVASLFSTDYLKEISRVFRDADKVTVSMNTDHPIRIECVVDETILEFLIAPRIEQEG